MSPLQPRVAERRMIAAVPPDLTFHYWFLPQAYAVVPLLEGLLEARIAHTRITNERKRVARMQKREKMHARLHRCTVCGGELPEGTGG